MEAESANGDICRVCRSEGAPDKPLYHPCVCTGSIKFIHQDCLVQWLKYSRKEYCELCKHKFMFKPIYAPDMPKRLPIKDIISGLLKSVGRAVRYWFHYTLVAIAWLGVVPLTACRIYRCLFTGSVSSLLTLPLDMLSTENILADCFQGFFVVLATLLAFISLVWLREQILHGGGPDWLDFDHAHANNQQPVNNGANGGVREAEVQEDAAQPAREAAPVAGEAEQQEVVEEQEQADDPQAAAAQENGANNAGAAQDNDWNPIEWDRAAEELTVERLLGLDGSLVFLEHVFWVVSLNTLFILVFAFCPYHIGHFIIIGMKFEDWISGTQFEGLLTTLLGYLVISGSLVILHLVAAVAKFKRSKRIVGVCYVVVKVSLLVVVELGIFPLICGWWLDICSLPMFDATIKDRETSFKMAPGTSMAIHWLVGMVYVFYFASFILLLREVLRPGVLWFLRDLNDPDFNPIQEMIHLPMYRHIRRFLASMVIFGSTVLVMLYLPVRAIKCLFSAFLPYNVSPSDSPASELYLELLLLQVVVPALLEQGHTRQWLKNLVRAWCVGVSWVLDIRSYLLGDVPIDEKKEERVEGVLEPQEEGEEGEQQEEEEEVDQADPQEVQEVPEEHEEERQEEVAAEQNEEDQAPAPALPNIIPQAPVAAQGLGAAHQALLQGGGPTGFQPYKKPEMFGMKLMCLFFFMCVTLFLTSIVSLIIPVFIGRKLMSMWAGETKIHELYTAGCGLYTIWIVLRASTITYTWIPQGVSAMFGRIREWTVLALKSVIVASLLIGVVPLLLGLLVELVLVVPYRVPLEQTPVFFLWQDWALGVLQFKIIICLTLMGPQWWLKRAIEQVYNQGLRNMDLKLIITSLCLPTIGCLAMSLAVPYVFAKSIVPLLGFGFDTQNLILRRIYPFLLGVAALLGFCTFQARQFKRLYEHIKNDKYLVGQRLVNYERKNVTSLLR